AESVGRRAMGVVDFEGRYAFEDLGAGDWLVRARVAGEGLEAHARVPLGPGAEAERDLDFKTGLTLWGSVLWDGEPLPRTAVVAHGLDAAVIRRASSNHEGRFELDNLPPGRYRIDASHGRELLSQNLDVDLRSSRELLVEFETSALTGRVVSKGDGSPVGAALISLRRRLDDPRAPGGSMASVASRADGTFRFGRLNRGTYDLTVRLDGFEPLKDTVEIDGGAGDVGPFDYELEPAVGLELAIHRADGSPPPPYVHVAIRGADGGAGHAEAQRVEAEGRVRLTTLREGAARLWIAAPGAVPARVEVQIPAADPVPVSLQAAGQLQVRVGSLVLSDGLAVLQLIGEDGRPWRAFDLVSGQTQDRWPLVAGVARVNGVPPGVWTVQVQSRAGRVWERAAATVAGREVRLDLE
ncbi:MAG: carboxypeptidase-like regulatory domain-containing protein, partial [Acidobacteriota bacterium]